MLKKWKSDDKRFRYKVRQIDQSGTALRGHSGIAAKCI